MGKTIVMITYIDKLKKIVKLFLNRKTKYYNFSFKDILLHINELTWKIPECKIICERENDRLKYR